MPTGASILTQWYLWKKAITANEMIAIPIVIDEPSQFSMPMVKQNQNFTYTSYSTNNMRAQQISLPRKFNIPIFLVCDRICTSSDRRSRSGFNIVLTLCLILSNWQSGKGISPLQGLHLPQADMTNSYMPTFFQRNTGDFQINLIT